MRVAHFQYDDLRNPWVGGGGAVRAHEIYRRLVHEHGITVYTGRYPGAKDETLDDVEYVRLGSDGPYAWSRWTFSRQATRVLRAGMFDAAVVDYSLYTPIVLPPSKHVALNFNQLTGDTVAQRFGLAAGAALRAVERRRMRRATTISVMSTFLLDRIQPLARRDAAFFVVGAGVDPGLFEVQRREEDYVLYYGRFDIFQKGIDTILEAAAAILREHTGVRLVVSGRGRDAGRIAAMVAEHAYRSRISIEENIGPKRRAELFAGALALLMPSRFEGFGMVAAEAMAAGVPVVASDRDSLPEVVGSAGITVPAENAAALAEAAGRVLADPALRADLAASGRNHARRYSWTNVAGEQLRLLRHLAQTTSQRT